MSAIKKCMSEKEIDEGLIENWEYLNENQRKLLSKLGVKPE